MIAMDYCERLKHYLDDCDENTDLIKEAIALLEGHFELIQENELLHFSRVYAVAYLALKSIVRCKDCKWFHQAFKSEGRCIKHDNDYHDPDWFCADAERKE